MTSRLRIPFALGCALLLAGCSSSQRAADRPEDRAVRPADQAASQEAPTSVRPRIGVLAAMDIDADSLESEPFGDPEAVDSAEPLDALPWASGESELDTITVNRYYYDDDGQYYVDEDGTSVYGGEDYYEANYSSYDADYYHYDDPAYYASPYTYYQPYRTYSPYYSYGWCRDRYYGYYGGYGRYRCHRPSYAYAGYYSPYWNDPFFFDPYFYSPGLYVSVGWGFGYGHGYNGYRQGYWDGYTDGSYRGRHQTGRRWRYADRTADRDRRGTDDGERGRVGSGIARAPIAAGAPSRGSVPSIGQPTRVVRTPAASPTRDGGITRTRATPSREGIARTPGTVEPGAASRTPSRTVTPTGDPSGRARQSSAPEVLLPELLLPVRSRAASP